MLGVTWLGVSCSGPLIPSIVTDGWAQVIDASKFEEELGELVQKVLSGEPGKPSQMGSILFCLRREVYRYIHNTDRT